LRKGCHGLGVVKNEDKVCEFETNLSAETTTNLSDCAGGRPRSVGETCDDDAGAKACGAEEAGFEDCEDS
jgi:hypothetical protein